jgi:hypothetical protein
MWAGEHAWRVAGPLFWSENSTTEGARSLRSSQGWAHRSPCLLGLKSWNKKTKSLRPGRGPRPARFWPPGVEVLFIYSSNSPKYFSCARRNLHPPQVERVETESERTLSKTATDGDFVQLCKLPH